MPVDRGNDGNLRRQKRHMVEENELLSDHKD